jgi:superfamily I DNA/RNA helicase
MLRPLRVLGWLADPDRLRAYAEGILSFAEIRLLAASYAELAAGPTVADVALLDELDELLGRQPQPPKRQRDPFQVVAGVREVSTYADRQRAARAAASARPEDYRDYAHLVVDEAQDVSPMQWRMLGRRGRLASWTIVGDPAQTAWTGNPAEVDRSRDAALRGRGRHAYTLSTNYRNSAEIFELAARVIRRVEPDLALPVAVRSTGVPPVLRTVDRAALPGAVGAAAAGLLDELEGTVGVITPVRRHGEVAGWLSDPRTGSLPPRLQVVTSLEAKGMEYDGVVLVEPGEVCAEAPSGVRTLYVALSRATQRLVTVSTGEWLPR